MENQFSLVLRLSLKEIAVRRLVVNLWNESDILLLIEKVLSFPAKHANCTNKKTSECIQEWRTMRYGNSKQWHEIVESKVRQKIKKLVLPNLVKKQMLRIMTPVGLEIKRWKGCHEGLLSWRNNLNSYVEFNAPILAKLCWTTTGKIDYLKTAQELILCEELSILNRYIIACSYCLEDFILYFWEKLPEEIKMKFYDEKDTPRIRSLNLEFYWPYILKGEQAKLDRFFRSPYPLDLLLDHRRIMLHTFNVLRLDHRVRCQYSFNLVAFHESASSGNKIATEYFFHKLTDEEKEATLNITTDVTDTTQLDYIDHGKFPPGSISDVGCYLLSLMTQKQQTTLFKKTKLKVLCLFLEWPWQDLFLEIADRIWEFLSEIECEILMQRIYNHFWQTKYYFPELFQEFFSRSPIIFRKLFVDRECGLRRVCINFSRQKLRDFGSGSFLRTFFHSEDSDTIQVIFRNISAKDRYRLVSCKNTFVLFYDFILRGSWRMVEVCLREATLSEEDRERVKISFFKFLELIAIGEITWRDPQWKRFSQLVDEIGTSFESKRNSKEETLCKVKRFCTYK